MCLLFCFVLFWILCCVVCEKKKKKIVDNKKKKRQVSGFCAFVNLKETESSKFLKKANLFKLFSPLLNTNN